MFLSFPILFFIEGINFPSKHNVAPLYWLLLLGVLCQRLKQIMVSSHHSLILREPKLFLKLVKNPIKRLSPDDKLTPEKKGNNNVLKLNSTLHLLSTYKLKDCYVPM